MPIDFAAVAAQFSGQLANQTHPLPLLFDRLEDAVKQLVEQSERAERATRAYPIFRYRDGALAVNVDPLGAALLPSSTAALGLADGLKAGGHRFLAELGWTATAARQELALPALLGVARGGVQAVVDSIDRFRRPTVALFDDRERRLSDVFGLLVLGYNSLLGADAREQLIGAATGPAGLYRESQRLFPPTAPTGRSTVDSLVESAAGLAEQVLAAVVLLPLLGEAIAVLVQDGALAAKRLILDELGKVESEVHALRAAAIDGLLGGIDLGQVAADWLATARAVVLTDLVILTIVLPSLVQSFLTGLRAFAAGVSAWGAWLADLLGKIKAVVDGIMNFDLVGAILRAVFPDWLAKRLPVPHITIDQLVSFLLGIGQAEVKIGLDLFFDSALRLINAADHLPGVDLDKLYWRVDALAKAFDIVLTPTPPLPPDALPALTLPGFPDIYDAFFGGGRAGAFVDSIDTFGVEVRGGIGSALAGAATTFDELGATFAAEADRAASMGSVARMRELAADSAVLAERVFGPEADRLRTDAGARQPDQLAAAFEQAVTTGGFALVGGAIPAYVGELRRFWETKRPPVPHPTSPHILARHGRLGGVRVPQLTVRARGRVPNRQLATLVGARLHEAIGEAYVGGRREFERLGGPPLRRPARAPARRPVPTRPGGGSGP